MNRNWRSSWGCQDGLRLCHFLWLFDYICIVKSASVSEAREPGASQLLCFCIRFDQGYTGSIYLERNAWILTQEMLLLWCFPWALGTMGAHLLCFPHPYKGIYSDATLAYINIGLTFWLVGLGLLVWLVLFLPPTSVSGSTVHVFTWISAPDKFDLRSNSASVFISENRYARV